MRRYISILIYEKEWGFVSVTKECGIYRMHMKLYFWIFYEWKNEDMTHLIRDVVHMWCLQKQTQLLIGVANHTPLGLKFQRTHFLLDRKIYKKHGTSKSFGLLFKSEMTCCSLWLFSLILLFAFSLCQKRKQNDAIFFSFD